MTKAIEDLPFDIKWQIAQYIDDIDTRRKFNIYSKINLKNYDVINRSIRKPPKNYGNCQRFEFHSNHENIGIRNLENDIMDSFITVEPDKVVVVLYVYKLRKRPGSNKHHYWQNVIIKYVMK
jgi:hypothetical protein